MISLGPRHFLSSDTSWHALCRDKQPALRQVHMPRIDYSLMSCWVHVWSQRLLQTRSLQDRVGTSFLSSHFCPGDRTNPFRIVRQFAAANRNCCRRRASESEADDCNCLTSCTKRSTISTLLRLSILKITDHRDATAVFLGVPASQNTIQTSARSMDDAEGCMTRMRWQPIELEFLKYLVLHFCS